MRPLPHEGSPERADMIKIKTKAKPSLEAIKSRAKKTVPETTVEDILAVTE